MLSRMDMIMILISMMACAGLMATLFFVMDSVVSSVQAADLVAADNLVVRKMTIAYQL